MGATATVAGPFLALAAYAVLIEHAEAEGRVMVSTSDAIIRCMKQQRTTVSASLDDLETLRAEARRRGITLAQLMRETLAEKAAALRAARRPRVGVGRGGGHGVARESVEDEEAPARGD